MLDLSISFMMVALGQAHSISDGDGAGAAPPGGAPWGRGLVADDAPGTLRRVCLS